MKRCSNCGKELTQEQRHNKYCGIKCQHDYQYKQFIIRWKNGEEDGIVGRYEISNMIKRYLREKYNNSCQVCGWNKVNPITNSVPLQIHHMDGNCLNNKEDNLQLLCPNCHSLTETYGHLNRVSSRIFRKQKGNL